MKQKTQVKSLATLTVHRFATLTPARRDEIVRWLELQVETLKAKPLDLSRLYTSRFLVRQHEPVLPLRRKENY